jgi:NADH dehydrogenase (ubiquinone) Fe-S protein 6
MQPPPEVFRSKQPRVYCDGSGQVDPALGHPRIYLRIDDETGFVDCGYCDRRFILEGGPADRPDK